ncbi:MAG: LTA synthase family protein [Acetatifactor sp.]|nr:LTA synthase family protein [Acetatifactor sp.]
MFVLWGTLAGLALWLELVYHFSGFGWTMLNPFYMIFLIVAWSGLWTLLIGVLKKRIKKIAYYVAIWLPTVWTSAQLVYLRIFKQPLLWEVMIRGGGDALTNYWRETLVGILKALPFLILLMLPAIAIPILLKWYRWRMPQFRSLQVMRSLVIVLVGIVGSVMVMKIGEIARLEYYEEYSEFYDPLIVAEEMGVLPLFHGDMTDRLRRLIGDWQRSQNRTEYVPVAARPTDAADGLPEDGTREKEDPDETAGPEPTPEVPEPPVIRPHQFDLDYDLLHQIADNKHQTWLADYIQYQVPVTTNEYTGMFEGYNLIFLTAEGFCTYAIDEELTPTLYKLANSGFVCENYYVPLWSTSTSDGEYINMTGLIPDGQHSMRNSAVNVQPFVLPAFFKNEGVYSYAYHNGELSYYERHETHPNMGYDFKACKLGKKLSEEEWGDKIFEMEQPTQWPASDYNMMVATVPEYVNDERFHVYYMTVSGHLQYSFSGNAMSSKNKEAVAELELSAGPKAYIACNIELDKAMENLLEQLEAAGQLENTVICLSADHYPYGLTDEEYEELAGKDLSAGKDFYRNTLILWNAGMGEPVYIDKACGPMDLLPTLLNLFGFEYDSRLYAGRDILSDREGLVVFMNRDFVTDSVIFIEKGDITTWLQDENGDDIVPDDQKESYLADRRQEVKDRYNFSAYIIQEDYYSDVLQAMIR